MFEWKISEQKTETEQELKINELYTTWARAWMPGRGPRFISNRELGLLGPEAAAAEMPEKVAYEELVEGISQLLVEAKKHNQQDSIIEYVFNYVTFNTDGSSKGRILSILMKDVLQKTLGLLEVQNTLAEM